MYSTLQRYYIICLFIKNMVQGMSFLYTSGWFDQLILGLHMQPKLLFILFDQSVIPFLSGISSGKTVFRHQPRCRERGSSLRRQYSASVYQNALLVQFHCIKLKKGGVQCVHNIYLAISLFSFLQYLV